MTSWKKTKETANNNHKGWHVPLLFEAKARTRSPPSNQQTAVPRPRRDRSPRPRGLHRVRQSAWRLFLRTDYIHRRARLSSVSCPCRGRQAAGTKSRRPSYRPHRAKSFPHSNPSNYRLFSHPSFSISLDQSSALHPCSSPAPPCTYHFFSLGSAATISLHGFCSCF